MPRLTVSKTMPGSLIKRIGIGLKRHYCHDIKHIPPLTSCEELFKHTQQNSWFEKIRILDARWDLHNREYHALHMENRIPASKFFSFEECRDSGSPFDRMLPASVEFSEYVTKLGICNKHHVIVYDDDPYVGAYSSPRVWWMFRAFGHNKVSILNGGFGKWISDGYPTVSGPYKDEEKLPGSNNPFLALKNPKFVVNFEAVKENATSENPKQLLDARSRKRFHDAHIPKSTSTPFIELFNEDKTFKSSNELKEYFKDNHVDLSTDDIITLCGSGITGSIVAHALYQCGREASLYDGSFSEWKVRAPELIVSDDTSDDKC